MASCKKEYDYERLLLDCGFSTSRSKQAASSLRAAIRKQDNEMKTKECNCNEVVKTTPKVVKPVKNKDVNEVLDLRKKDKEEK